MGFFLRCTDKRYVWQAEKKPIPSEGQALHVAMVPQQPKLPLRRQPQATSSADASFDGPQTGVAALARSPEKISRPSGNDAIRLTYP